MQTIRALFVLAAICIASAQLSYINITSVPSLAPESMDYVSGTGYILGSLSYGGAYRVSPTTGAISVFLQQGQNMNHTAGVQYDTRGGRNRVLLCSVTLPPPFGAGGHAGGVISLELSGSTPTLAAFYDTSAIGPNVPYRFCNDIVTDDAGTIYATDSFGSQVWKISTSGVVSQLIYDQRWNATSFALDGIEMTREGNLIVSHITHSQLWLITLTPSVFATQIQVSGNYINSSPDGIYFGPFGCLHTVGNNNAYRLASTDGWLTATVLEVVPVTCLGPTAIAWNADAGYYYVSCGHDFDAGPYALERITFTTIESAVLCHTNTTSTTSGCYDDFSFVLVASIPLAIMLTLL